MTKILIGISVFFACLICCLILIMINYQKSNSVKNKKHQALSFVEIETAYKIASALSCCNVVPKKIILEVKSKMIEVKLHCTSSSSVELKTLRKKCDIPSNWELTEHERGILIKIQWIGKIYGSRHTFTHNVWKDIRKKHPEWKLVNSQIVF